MSLTKRTIDVFNKNLQKCAEDKLTDRTTDKVAVVKLLSGIITQTLDDLYNGNDEQKLDADSYIKSKEFNKHCSLLGIDSGLVLRMILNIDNTIIDYDDIVHVYGNEDEVK